MILVLSSIFVLLIVVILWRLIEGIIYCYYKNRNKKNKIYADENSQREGAEQSPNSGFNNLTSQQLSTQGDEPSLSAALTGLSQPMLYSPTVQVTERPQINASERERVPLVALYPV